MRPRDNQKQNLVFKYSTLEEIRQFGDFARTYLWDCSFEGDYTLPSKTFFPATDVSEQVFDIATDDFNASFTSFSVPTRVGLPQITLVFLDTEERVYKKWIQNWKNEIYNFKTGTVQTLSECSRLLRISYLGGDLLPKETVKYNVFPIGKFSSELNSRGGLVSYEMSFMVSGKLDN